MQRSKVDQRELYARQWHEGRGIRWFVIATFAATWVWWLAGLAALPEGWAAGRLLCLATGMWWPGVAALAVTSGVLREPWATLRFARRGPWRYYLWAWALPIAAAGAAVVAPVLLGVAQFDPEFTLLRRQAAGEAGQDAPGFAPQLAAVSALLTAVSAAPLLHGLFALGEELGWRGFLLPRFLRFGLGPGQAWLATGVIWGLWHAPLVLVGQNFPGHPTAGLLMMIVYCVVAGAWLAWLRMASGSIWPAVLAHGTLNAVGSLPMLFLKPGYSSLVAGTLTSFCGVLPLAALVIWLGLSGRLELVADADEPAV